MVEPPDDDVTPPSDRSRVDRQEGDARSGRPDRAEVERLRGRPLSDDADTALADLRSDMSIEDLRRLRAERDRSREEMTTGDVLSRSVGRTVTIWTSSGVVLTGEVVEVGSDYGCISTPGATAWIPTSGITAIRSQLDPVRSPAARAGTDSRFIDVIHDMVMAEVAITLTLRGDGQVTGTPLVVGESVTLIDDQTYTTVDARAIIVLSRPGSRHDRT